MKNQGVKTGTLGGAEDNLRESEQLLRLATEAADMFASELDFTTGKITWAGNAAAVIGCTQDELTRSGTSTAFFVLNDDRDRIDRELATALANGKESYVLDFRGVDPEGDRGFWRSCGRIFRDNKGAVLRALSVTQNVTRQRATEQALVIAAERLKTAEIAAGALIYDFDLARNVYWRSDGFERMLGWQPDDIAPGEAGWASLRHPEDQQRLTSPRYADYLKPDGHYVLEYRVRHRDGRYIWVLDSGRVFRNGGGEIVRVSGAAIDITGRKSAETGRAHLAAVAFASHDALIGVSLDGRIETWNPAASRLFGYQTLDAIGMPISRLSSADRRPEALDFVARGRKGEAAGPIETKWMRKDGTIIEVSIAVAPDLAQDGTPLAVSFVVQDITDRKEWQARQRMMTRELAHRVKNSFAVLQSILRATLRASPDPQDFAEAFSGRLHSLAAAQDILTATDWKYAELGALARHQLSTIAVNEGDRLTISGPAVYLAAENSVPLALIFNELATNAIKHGALSTGPRADRTALACRHQCSP